MNLPWSVDAAWLPWLDLWGRLHPLLVHVPLGVLPALVLLELWGCVRKRPLDTGVRRGLISVSALVALLGAAGGWLLAEEPAYGGADLEWHRKLGLGLAGASTLAMLAAWTGVLKVYGWALLIAIGLLLPTGHVGGSMVHGDDFVSGPLFAAWEGRRYEPPRREPGDATTGQSGASGADDADGPADADGAQPGVADDPLRVDPAGVYAIRVAPLIESYCAACHGADKQRGYLALHTPAGILAGGEFGPALAAGDAGASELVRRLRLPLEGEAHMPPEGKRQPSEAEIATLAAWIDAGASFGAAPESALVAPLGSALDVTFAPGPAPGAGSAAGSVQVAADAQPGGLAAAGADAEAAALPASPDPDALRLLSERLVHWELVDPARGLLWIDFAARPACADAELAELLVPLAGSVAELSLAGTALSDAGLASVAQLRGLQVLDLRGTAVTAEGLSALAELTDLARLNLTGTAVDDGALETLANLPALSRLFVWDSALTPVGRARLSELRPELVIEDGRGAAVEPLEVEPVVEFVAFVKPVSEAAAAVADLTPVNSVCPVSGGPVDPRYAVVHDGRVIGFCCNECPVTFWADPAAYPLPE